MKQICLLLLISLPLLGSGQLNRIVCELYHEDDGLVEGYPKGYKTYRIFAELEDSSIFLTSVFAYGCNDLKISANNDIWQHPMGALLGSDLNPAMSLIDPSVVYDSFLTIGKSNRSDGKGSVIRAIAPDDPSFELFEAGKDLQLTDGAWACLNSDSIGYGPKVLIAQITTSQPISYSLNLQVIYDKGKSMEYNAIQYDDSCTFIGDEEGKSLGLLKF